MLFTFPFRSRKKIGSFIIYLFDESSRENCRRRRRRGTTCWTLDSSLDKNNFQRFIEHQALNKIFQNSSHSQVYLILFFVL
jgi:hypothetical protein